MPRGSPLLVNKTPQNIANVDKRLTGRARQQRKDARTGDRRTKTGIEHVVQVEHSTDAPAFSTTNEEPAMRTLPTSTLDDNLQVAQQVLPVIYHFLDFAKKRNVEMRYPSIALHQSACSMNSRKGQGETGPDRASS